jgi:glycosyltransferase involved in cell wall biosynthesis
MNRNGLENRLMDIYRNIDRSMIQFDFMTNRSEDGEFDEEIRQLGGRVFHMSRIAPKSFFKYLVELKQFFKVHTEYKIVHSHLNTLSTWPLLMAKRAGVPIRIAHSRNASMDKNIKMLYKAFSRLFISGQATDRFACSRSAGIWLFGKRQVEKESFRVIPNAIQLDRFLYSEEKRNRMRGELNILENELAIVCVARFSPQKNHAYLLRVFQEIKTRRPDSKLYLVGKGELETDIRNQIAEMGLDNDVVFLGSRSDVGDVLTAMDAFLFPSFYEGFGTVIIEAQCSALPMIASDTIPQETKLCESVEFMSLNKNPAVWADKILQLIEGNARKDNSALIRQCGYDIRQSYTWMQEFYLKKIREC